MFGVILKKNCPNCNEIVNYITAVLYMIEGKEYTDDFICPKCNADLAEEEREIIKKARNDGKKVITILC
ncbi:MAG: hypothetical protein ACE3L7_05100 [Candidatus Pristimantibacillus sp.]